jgi:20S proteasome alpha/beta subunit
MTIVIGALCDGGKGIVLASDKMMIYPNQDVVLLNCSKNRVISNNGMALISGTAQGDAFLDNLNKDVGISATEFLPIESICEKLSEYWVKCLIKQIERRFLPYAGFAKFEDFHAKQSLLHPRVIEELLKYTSAYSLGVWLILGGFNNSGMGRIAFFNNTGDYSFFDDPGFICSGIGGNRANPVFEFMRYHKNMNEGDVVDIVFAAKKRTESLGGIGKETDVWIMKQSGISKMDEKKIAELEKNIREITVVPKVH